VVFISRHRVTSAGPADLPVRRPERHWHGVSQLFTEFAHAA
jgi:hypothetical protein